MENENTFDNYPKISIDSLLKEEFIQSINLSENESGNMIIELKNKYNLSVNVQIGKITRQKLLSDTAEKTVLKNGYIALIPFGIAPNNLRFYTSEYQNLNEFFPSNFEEERILKEQKEKIRNILKNHLK